MRLVYSIGRERGEIVEKQKFEESIFAEQYVRALSLVNQFIDPKEASDNLKVVAFCGDRGEGKSSCMRTVLNMLAPDDNTGKEDKESIKAYINDRGLKNIAASSFEVLDVIDPSFFDNCHNVIELVLGRMYIQMIGQEKEVPDMDYTCRNSIMGKFQQAKKCLYTLHESSDGHIDELQELDALAAGIELKKHMNVLIRNFLQLVKKQWLIVSIDDIDLNMSEAYQMCEHIRKYLACERCIVFIGVKPAQLQDAISIAIQRSLDKTYPPQDADAFGKEIIEMTRKYIGKFLPAACRINMPKVYSLCESVLQIQGEEDICEGRNIKDAVVNLIFSRTRYLFYNSKGGVSPIIPNNLRDLIAMIGLLVSMPRIEDSYRQKAELEANKPVFKDYFFATWIKRMPQKSRERVEKIINDDLSNALNKTVVSILGDFFSEVQERDYSKEDSNEGDAARSEKMSASQVDKLLKVKGIRGLQDLSKLQQTPRSHSLIMHILDSKNFGYNVSLGDVFYLFRLIEMDTLDEESSALIFFLKSLYSIKLYEAYDSITDRPDMVYPVDDEKTKGIYRMDARFDHTNSLQRLLCGGYFTYCPGDLLPLQGGNDSYDMRIINGKELAALLKEIKTKIESREYENDENFGIKLRMAEFFILTIIRSVPSKQTSNIIGAVNKNRSNCEPFYLTKFFPETGYYLFDILAPFYNLSNPRFAYERFAYEQPDEGGESQEKQESLFDFALGYEKSLLYQIIKICSEHRAHIEHSDEQQTRMHCLQSDAIIRNAEVLSAVYENAVLTRDNNRKGVDLSAIQSFYRRIQNSNMATHMDRYMISFHFLEPLQNFINEISSLKTQTTHSSEVAGIFNRIFRVSGSEIPTYEQIMAALSAAVAVKSLYPRLRSLAYFKGWSDEQLAEVIPNTSPRYTRTEVRAYVKEWTQKNN